MTHKEFLPLLDTVKCASFNRKNLPHQVFA
jgi:hypothetical protein